MHQRPLEAAGYLLLDKNPLMNQKKATRPPSRTPCKGVTLVCPDFRPCQGAPCTLKNTDFQGDIFRGLDQIPDLTGLEPDLNRIVVGFHVIWQKTT